MREVIRYGPETMGRAVKRAEGMIQSSENDQRRVDEKEKLLAAYASIISFEVRQGKNGRPETPSGEPPEQEEAIWLPPARAGVRQKSVPANNPGFGAGSLPHGKFVRKSFGGGPDG